MPSLWERWQRKKDQEKEADDKETQRRVSDHESAVISALDKHVAEQQATRQSTEHHQTHERAFWRQQLGIEWWLNVFTLATALGSLAGIVVLYFTLVDAQEATTAANRAWVGPTNAAMDTEPTVGKPIEITVQYQNTGREPALGFTYDADSFAETAAGNSDGADEKRLNDYLARCKATTKWEGGSVVFPTTTNAYNLSVKTSDNLVTDAVVKGDSVIDVQGCFHYRTFGAPHYSYFCFVYKHGVTKISNLNICITGQEAN